MFSHLKSCHIVCQRLQHLISPSPITTITQTPGIFYIGELKFKPNSTLKSVTITRGDIMLFSFFNSTIPYLSIVLSVRDRFDFFLWVSDSSWLMERGSCWIIVRSSFWFSVLNTWASDWMDSKPDFRFIFSGLVISFSNSKGSFNIILPGHNSDFHHVIRHYTPPGVCHATSGSI